ncbi:MAG: type II secretion system F family protein [Propioniciclava sp.]
MIEVGIVLATMVTVAGGVMLAWSLLGPRVGRPADPVAPSGVAAWMRHAGQRLPRRTWVLVCIGLAVGVIVTVWTGWYAMAVVVPVAVVGLPTLLSAPPQTEIEILGALDRWVRAMGATLATGKSMTEALRASASGVPERLIDPVAMLTRHLDDGWTSSDALQAFADELDSPDADAVVASLILAAERGGTGSVLTLAALADSIQDRLHALRELESERAKPRIVVRQVTLITLIVLGGSLLLVREFFAPFGTPVGQVLLTALLTVYVLSLVALRRMTLPRPRSRILRSDA